MVKRENMMWLVKDGDIPETGTCKYAESCPKVRKCADSLVDQEKELQRKSVLKVVSNLLRHLDLADGLNDVLEERIDRKSKSADPANADTWKATTVGHLDQQWLGNWIISKTQVTGNMLEKAKAWEPDVCTHLFSYMNNVTNGLSLPDECESKLITALAFNRRWESQGKRLEGYTDKQLFDDRGSVLWLEVGPYELVWNNESKLATAVKHNASGHVAEIKLSEAKIDTDYLLEFGYRRRSRSTGQRHLEAHSRGAVQQEAGPLRREEHRRQVEDLQRHREGVLGTAREALGRGEDRADDGERLQLQGCGEGPGGCGPECGEGQGGVGEAERGANDSSPGLDQGALGRLGGAWSRDGRSADRGVGERVRVEGWLTAQGSGSTACCVRMRALGAFMRGASLRAHAGFS